jgi:hypothetical protein
MPKISQKRFENIRYAALKLVRVAVTSSPVRQSYVEISEADAVYFKKKYGQLDFYHKKPTSARPTRIVLVYWVVVLHSSLPII